MKQSNYPPTERSRPIARFDVHFDVHSFNNSSIGGRVSTNGVPTNGALGSPPERRSRKTRVAERRRSLRRINLPICNCLRVGSAPHHEQQNVQRHQPGFDRRLHTFDGPQFPFNRCLVRDAGLAASTGAYTASTVRHLNNPR